MSHGKAGSIDDGAGGRGYDVNNFTTARQGYRSAFSSDWAALIWGKRRLVLKERGAMPMFSRPCGMVDSRAPADRAGGSEPHSHLGMKITTNYRCKQYHGHRMSIMIQWLNLDKKCIVVTRTALDARTSRFPLLRPRG